VGGYGFAKGPDLEVRVAIGSTAGLSALALNALATGSGNLRNQLENAHTFHFMDGAFDAGSVDELPEDLQQRISQPASRLTAVPGPDETGVSSS
jgi:hypothetical protein